MAAAATGAAPVLLKVATEAEAGQRPAGRRWAWRGKPGIPCAGKKVFEWSRLPERERRAGFGGSGAGKTEQKEKKIDVNVNI